MKKKIKEKSSVQDFADTIKDNPSEIIKWAEAEIREYQRLIKILKKRNLEKNKKEVN